MAEGVPPFNTRPNDPPPEADDPQPESDSPHDGSGNFIVQFPKDQVYWVPPPENARLAEQFRNLPPHKTCFSPCLRWFLAILVLLVIILGLVLTLSYLLMKPNPPTIHINKISTSHHSSSTPKYHIVLKLKNVNSRMDLSYENGGSAILSQKGHKIAKGKPPSFYQNSNNSTNLQLLLRGSSKKLPNDIKKSMEGKGSKKSKVSLSLSISIPLKVVGAIWTRGMNLDAECDLTVNTLAKGTRVTSQSCHGKIST